jgi:hypothetical protein
MISLRTNIEYGPGQHQARERAQHQADDLRRAVVRCDVRHTLLGEQHYTLSMSSERSGGDVMKFWIVAEIAH